MRETEGESTGVAAPGTPSLDLIFDILSNRRRRYVLYYLHEQPDGVATADEITDAVVSYQYATASADGDETAAADGDDSEPDLEQRRLRVQTELQHTHLPKLEDAGVIEHDNRSEAVRYWTQPSLEEWLEHAKHKERL
ncbi:DUF7344 domain-containing protein [Haloterrigena alkaliphila]|uniref:DUF7344 domain-containing protein n=1 Tax=Haloterrigena alkaliphila TaxID=2816475 RepID=A0A8A2VG91_9EURY|nr:hypothetical protein [Haloterrigena alkaliphila]QSW99394.1 hypothetical protein J0X25_00095 [Haloterrigena alkaliphila]